jgi:hypothetical protein
MSGMQPVRLIDCVCVNAGMQVKYGERSWFTWRMVAVFATRAGIVVCLPLYIDKGDWSRAITIGLTVLMFFVGKCLAIHLSLSCTWTIPGHHVHVFECLWLDILSWYLDDQEQVSRQNLSA